MGREGENEDVCNIVDNKNKVKEEKMNGAWECRRKRPPVTEVEISTLHSGKP